MNKYFHNGLAETVVPNIKVFFNKKLFIMVTNKQMAS